MGKPIPWDSTDELLAWHDRCRIPHFQRGLVWGPDSVALLLESLFYGTPCGTVILWKPLEPEDQGVPLANGAEAEHLIVDGQQRIRSLHAVFRTAREASEEGADPVPDPDADVADPAGAGPERIWCIDLTHVSVLRAVFGRPSRFSLFRLVADPSQPKARFKHGLVPLRWIFDGGAAPRIEQHLETLHPKVRAWASVQEARIVERVREMRSRPLFGVHVLEESETEHHLADVVRLYNRINSGGRRVEAEERAYAMLVAQAPSTESRLREFFASVHGDPGAAATATHDDLLRRRKERAFGFKLFVRTFVQIATYHLRFSIGTSAFSFDLLSSPTFRDRLDDPATAQAIDKMLGSTKEVLTFIREVLREHLYCDDLQRLPEASSLWPVTQLLVRFPRVMEGGAGGPGARVVAAVLLRLYLAPRSTRELLARIAEINRAQTFSACAGALAKTLSLEEAAERMRRGVASARSLQDRYVLLLYWLLRKLGAKDFVYANLDRLGRKPKPDHAEFELEEGVEPEKQHLVSYSRLAVAYGITGRVRVSSHKVNDIGNLT